MPPSTDSNLLENPFIKPLFGRRPNDTDAAAGMDTPSLVNLWDSVPYLHHSNAPTTMAVLTTFNLSDQHGVTSTLTTQEKTYLIAFLNQIVSPDSIPDPTDAPQVAASSERTAFQGIFPNPFRDETSLRFSLERSPSKVRIDVLDVTGRRVRRLLERDMPRGVHIVGWDSKNDEGRFVAAYPTGSVDETPGGSTVKQLLWGDYVRVAGRPEDGCAPVSSRGVGGWMKTEELGAQRLLAALRNGGLDD